MRNTTAYKWFRTLDKFKIIVNFVKSAIIFSKKILKTASCHIRKSSCLTDAILE